MPTAIISKHPRHPCVIQFIDTLDFCDNKTLKYPLPQPAMLLNIYISIYSCWALPLDSAYLANSFETSHCMLESYRAFYTREISAISNSPMNELGFNSIYSPSNQPVRITAAENDIRAIKRDVLAFLKASLDRIEAVEAGETLTVPLSNIRLDFEHAKSKIANLRSALTQHHINLEQTNLYGLPFSSYFADTIHPILTGQSPEADLIKEGTALDLASGNHPMSLI